MLCANPEFGYLSKVNIEHLYIDSPVLKSEFVPVLLNFHEVAVVHLGVRMKAYTVPVLHEDV